MENIKCPISTYYYDSGKIRSQCFYVNDNFNNTVNQFIKSINYYENGQISCKTYLNKYFIKNSPIKQGTSIYTPAVICYYNDGQIQFQEYWINGKISRPIEQGPARIIYYENSQISFQEWWENNQRHRPVEQGPATIRYYENGQLSYQEWWENDKRHRPVEQGPALIHYEKNGQIRYQEYWENGIQIIEPELSNRLVPFKKAVYIIEKTT